jgi:hypothetical protein
MAPMDIPFAPPMPSPVPQGLPFIIPALRGEGEGDFGIRGPIQPATEEDFNPQVFDPIAAMAPQAMPAYAEQQPGTLNGPEVQSRFADEFMQALSGLKDSRRRQDKARKDMDFNAWDEFVGGVLVPATGLIPGSDYKNAKAVSERILGEVQERKKQQRSLANEDMNYIKALAGIIQQTDPNDLSNDLKRMREERLLKKDEEGTFAQRNTADHRASKLDFDRDKHADTMKLNNRNQDRLDRAQDRLDDRLLLDIEKAKETSRNNIAELQYKREEAARRQDRFEVQRIDRQIEQQTKEYNRALQHEDNYYQKERQIEIRQQAVDAKTKKPSSAQPASTPTTTSRGPAFNTGAVAAPQTQQANNLANLYAERERRRRAKAAK